MDELPLVLTIDERSHDQTQVDLDWLGSLMAQALATQGVPVGSEAYLTLVDPERIAELKTEYLDGDGEPTDVISFPLDGPDIAEAIASSTIGRHVDDPMVVGDIIVCPSVAAKQAPGHAGTLEDELALLVIHGSLHLLGLDHADMAEQRHMWKVEREIMTRVHREPARDPWADSEQVEGPS